MKGYYNHTGVHKNKQWPCFAAKNKKYGYLVSWMVLPLWCGAYVELYYPNLIDQAIQGAQKCEMPLFWAKSEKYRYDQNVVSPE